MNKYIISFEQEESHYINLEYHADGPFENKTQVWLPNWRPGKYQMEDFAKNIQNWRAYDEKGNELEAEKIKKDCWEVNTKGIKELKVKYNYYAFKMDAGSSYLDENQLYVNPVNCCLYIAEKQNEKCRLELKLPESYVVATSAKLISKDTYEYEDFQELADSPFIASLDLKYDSFEVKDTTVHLWFQGECRPDYDRIKQDLHKMMHYQIEVMQDFKHSDYHYLLQMPGYELYHGVEHHKSTVITLGPGYRLMKDSHYRLFLALCSHEFFHSWNIKAIRPLEMYPYHFNRENYSKLGYVVEGVTSYYGDLFLMRSKVIDFKSYANTFKKYAQRHFHNYGRFYHSVAESSFDTWIDGYEKSAPNRKTSIYIKGMLVSMMLDVNILKETGNKKRLDDVMRALYQKYALKNKGYTEKDLLAEINDISGKDFRPFFEKYIWGVEPIEDELGECLDYLACNLSLKSSENSFEDKFGMKLKIKAENTEVDQIAPNSPAFNARLSTGDELVAVNGLKINKNLNELLDYHSEETMQITVFRSGHLKQFHLRADGKNYFPAYELIKAEQATKRQKDNFKAWSGHDW